MKTEKEFWIEYFKYEIKFIEKVMTRQILISKDIDQVNPHKLIYNLKIFHNKENEDTADFMNFGGNNKKENILLKLDNINSSDL